MTISANLIQLFSLDPHITQAEFDTFMQEYFAEQNDTYDAEVARHDRALFRRGR